MTSARAIRRLAWVLAFVTPLVALPSAAGSETASSYAGGEPAGSAGLEQTLRPVGDALFARPVNFLQLVGGVAMLPLALPIAAVFAEPEDALDICVTGPYEMLVRPLGE